MVLNLNKALFVSALTLLFGCSSIPSPEKTEIKLAELAARGGYLPGKSFSTSKSLKEEWRHEGARLNVLLTVPDTDGSLPLLVYLPGLGEPESAGDLWRDSWVKAGYAVFTVQAGSDGGRRGLSGQERPEETRMDGRRDFSRAALERRLHHLSFALNELVARQKSGQALFSRLDPDRFGVVGYDLGAQTVAALIGENTRASQSPASPLKPAAAIILSPFVDLAAGRLDDRFSGITVPTLTVTGLGDEDPYGIVSAANRQAFWRELPRDEKYLLLLKDGSHKLLSGSLKLHYELSGSGDFNPDQEADVQDFLEEFDSTSHEAAHDDPGGSHGPKIVQQRRFSPEQRIREIAAIRAVTTAFLDAEVKNLKPAREWLKRNSDVFWLGQSATLKVK